MTTSINDLIATLDHETSRRAHGAADASGALHHIAALIDDLRADELAQRDGALRDAAARRLADACREASVTFETGPGRLTDLAGVTRDAIVQLRRRLTGEDRWHIVTSTAVPARRCTAIIARSGPYTQVPQLLALRDRTGELLRVAAADPAAPEYLSALTAPIVSTEHDLGRSEAEQAVEAFAHLAAEFLHRSREPMTTRQLLGICHVSEAAARSLARDAAYRDTMLLAAEAWHQARTTISTFADRPRRGEATSDPILRTVVRAVTALDHVATSKGGVEVGAAEHIVALLPRLAAGCAAELDRIRLTLVVGRVERPLSEERVGEWLTRQAFLPNRADIFPAQAALTRAARLSLAAVSAPPLPSQLSRVAMSRTWCN